MTGMRGDRQGQLELACDEHERLTGALARVRAEQVRLLTAVIDGEIAPRLREAAHDLGFAIGGVRARGLVLAREAPHPQLFMVVDDDAWSLVERHVHGFHAVPRRVDVATMLEAFGRDSATVMREALATATRSSPEHGASVRVVSRAPSASPAPAPAPRTRPCPACAAQLKPKNHARHLRTIHGLLPDGTRVKPLAPPPGARHQVCRMCSARLPAGRLDAHLTAMHGVFHVHPAGDHGDPRARDERRREASRLSARRAASDPRPLPRPTTRPAPPSGGRDFLAETRHERTLVARADAPERNRDREGRFSDAPDVERMDGDSHA